MTNIIRPTVPKFGINEIVYLRESALNGYLEPQKIKLIQFDPDINKNWYTFSFSKNSPNSQTVGDAIDLKSAVSFKVLEDDLLTYEEALIIKRDFLIRELSKVEQQLAQKLTGSIIRIYGNNHEIVDGDVTPEIDDFTNFGDAEIPQETTFGNISQGVVVRTFEILNDGGDILLFTAEPIIRLVGDDDFEIETYPLDRINPGTTSSFRIAFKPFILGRRTAAVVIATNSSDSLFTFSIEGNGV